MREIGWRAPNFRRLLEGIGQRDQLRLAERRPHEGDAERQTERVARRDADRRIACERGGLLAPPML